ncbi:MAG TPA: NAD-dependent epimerase/dehydratase family protein [Flavobacteriales bacterium]|nr:NAD-dependent epimerase/dehydratase family protein [Flavobacteriales bacterium]
MGSTLLVTGGAGFVGSSFAIHWKKRHPGSTVIALDNLKRRGSELNLPRLKEAGVQFVHGDVRDAGDLLSLPHIDALVECSAEPSVLAGYGAGSKYVVDTNLVGTINCLDLVARDKADLVFLSTSRVYPIAAINGICELHNDEFRIDPATSLSGASQYGIAEDFPLAGVRSLYGATKLASELLITEYADMHGFRAVIDRCGVIAGPWQMGKTDQGFVLLWLARHLWNLPLQYIGFGGTGSQVRDVLHIDDLCDLVSYQLEHMGTVNGQTFNVGGGLSNSTTLRGFTELAQKATGRTIPISASSEDRQGDLKLYITNNALIQQATGWVPKRDLQTVFSDSYAWLKEHEDRLRPILT